MTVLEEMKLDLKRVEEKILEDLDVPAKVNRVMYERHLAEESFLLKYIKKLEEEKLKKNEIENLIVDIATDSLINKQQEIGLINQEGQPHLSFEWIKDNILNSKQQLNISPGANNLIPPPPSPPKSRKLREGSEPPNPNN